MALYTPIRLTTLPLIITGDSTAEITGLSGFRDYDFYVSVRREVEGQVVAGVRSGPIRAKPDCGAPQPVDSADVTSDSYNHLEITWSEPSSQCGAPSYNVSRRLVLNDQCDDSMADMVTWEVTGDTSIEYDDLFPYSTYEFTILSTLEGYDAETVYFIAYNSTESMEYASESKQNRYGKEVLCSTCAFCDLKFRMVSVQYMYEH
eukprot:XP_011660882.1 PREDICTED: uncharacterized protein LOC105436732 [Strongylocentrotus purpuratus]